MGFKDDIAKAREAFLNRDQEKEAREFDGFAAAYRQSILTVAEHWQPGTSEPSHLTNLGSRLGIDSATIQSHLAIARQVVDLQATRRRHAAVRTELETVKRELAEPMKRLKDAEAAVDGLDAGELAEADKRIAVIVKQNPELFATEQKV